MATILTQCGWDCVLCGQLRITFKISLIGLAYYEMENEEISCVKFINTDFVFAHWLSKVFYLVYDKFILHILKLNNNTTPFIRILILVVGQCLSMQSLKLFQTYLTIL